MTQSTATTGQKVKFATQLSPDVLAELRQMAHEEGRQIQSILDETLREPNHAPMSWPLFFPA